MDWDKLKTFHAAADAGSLTGAADILHLSQSAVSRQISALEEELGVKLFHRHTRGLMLTEPGKILFNSTKSVSKTIRVAESHLQDVRDEPSGVLRITATTSFGAAWLIPRLKSFRASYPQIEPHLLLVDHELDIANLEADIAIRPWSSKQNNLIQSKLMVVDQHLYATQHYLDHHGVPDSLHDLSGHQLIAYGPSHLAPIPNLNWHLKESLDQDQYPTKPVIEVNTIMALMAGVEAGLGLAGLPDYVAGANKNLVQVLPDCPGPVFDTYLLYPEELRGSRRIAAFSDFIRREVTLWKRGKS